MRAQRTPEAEAEALSGRAEAEFGAAEEAAVPGAEGVYVDLVSEWRDGVERRAPGFRVVLYPTARGCAAAYYPETNVLVPLDATADTSNTPASKSVVVRLEQSTTD